MISEIITRYISGPIARLWALIPFEPVMVAGLVLTVVTFFRDQLSDGADLETALTATIIMIGSKLVRENVWPAVKVSQYGEAHEPLGEPITGLDD